MSHVRKLFQAPPENGLDSSPVPLRPVAETPLRAVTEIAVVPPRDLLDIPIVEADIRPAGRIVFHTDPHSPGADRFRFLRMRLREIAKATKLKSLLVTSPLPHDGKSTTVLNLATALSEHGKHPVLVIEADLHHTSMTGTLGLPGWDGLAECLEAGLDPLWGIRRVEPLGWYLLPAGKHRRNPTELLQTPELAALMQKLAPRFEWILIDSPPAVPLNDALLLQHHADATLLAVRAGSTPREMVERALELLGRKRVLGIILNGVKGLDRLYTKYRSYRGSAPAANG